MPPPNNYETVDKLISNQCSITPSKIAIKHNQQTVTYQQVDELSNRLARFITAQNVAVGDVVGIAVNRSPEMVILLLAVAKAGATYLPIDHNFPTERVKYMLGDSGVKLLITTNNLKEQYQDQYRVITIEEALTACAGLDSINLNTQINPASIAYILYTSGSTGKPKGVKVTHLGLSNLLLSVQKSPGMDASDVMLQTTTISFDIAELEVFLPLICGGLLVIADAEKVKDGRALLEIAIAENITIMQGTPFMWRTMLEVGWAQRLPIKIFCGGEAMSRELAQGLVGKCNQLWNMYGPTETTIYSIIKQVTANDDVITIGNPIDNTQVYILNEGLQPVAAGDVGEIYIAGDGIAEGYINKPQLTDERFLANPFSPMAGTKMYKTGDLGRYLPNGEILCLGRIDHQIKIRGYRIETEEIEYQLKQQGNIKEALIIYYEDAFKNPHLIAYVVPANGLAKAAEADAIALWKTALKGVLPEYMIPSIFMVIGSIPLMPNGKIDRNSLPQPILNQSFANYQKPVTPTEIALTKIALEYIPVDKIGVNDSFFDLGLNSLMAVKIMVKVENQLGKRLPLSVLINYPTIKELAAVIDDPSQHTSYKTLVPIQPQGTKIPVYIIHGIGLNLLNVLNMLSYLHPDQPFYGIQSIGLDGTMEVPDTLEQIAAFYIDEMIKNDPVGPYALAGYSFGGFIAYEMAKQLKEKGKNVCLLAMFDTNLQYPTYQYPLLKKVAVKGVRQFKKAAYRLQTMLTQPADTAMYLKENTASRFKTSDQTKELSGDNLPDFMQAIVSKLYAAFYKYKFEPYHVKIDIFKAGDRLYYIDDPKTLGWKDYALDGVAVHAVPGNHKDMFENQNAKVLADIFQQRLNEMNALTLAGV
jgi:amino acid adenylation domain-containing protein